MTVKNVHASDASTPDTNAQVTNLTTYHHGDLRVQLIHDAAILLRQHGEAGLSMRKLATITGVSRTAPYHHFKDKHELLCAIAEDGFVQFSEVFKHLDTQATTPDLRQIISGFVQNYIDFATQSHEYYDLMFGGHLWKSERLTQSLKTRAHASFHLYVDAIRHWKAQGILPDHLDPLPFAQLSWATLHGMSRFLIDGIYVDQTAKQNMCRSVEQMFHRELGLV